MMALIGTGFAQVMSVAVKKKYGSIKVVRYKTYDTYDYFCLVYKGHHLQGKADSFHKPSINGM